MDITLVRHGQTIENVVGIVQGQLPGHLTPQGIQQAMTTAQALRNERFDRVICSDLQRCVDTANQIMQFHQTTPITYTSKLREIDLGDYQGLQSATIAWDALPGTVLTRRAPHAESGLEHRQRVIGYINELLAHCPHEALLIITHGGPIRNIRSSIEQADPLTIMDGTIDNCAILRYKIIEPLHV